MTPKQRRDHAEMLFEMCKGVTETAQVEYASESNVFENFEDGAAALGIPREVELGVLLHKHFRGIFSWIRGNRQQRDTLRGRIIDAINYLVLLDAMVNESMAQCYHEETEFVKRETPTSTAWVVCCKKCGEVRET